MFSKKGVSSHTTADALCSISSSVYDIFFTQSSDKAIPCHLTHPNCFFLLITILYRKKNKLKNFQFYNYVGKSEIKLKQEGYNLKAFIFLFIYNYKPHICYSSFLCALVINHYPSPLVLSCCLPLLLTSNLGFIFWFFFQVGPRPIF